MDTSSGHPPFYRCPHAQSGCLIVYCEPTTRVPSVGVLLYSESDLTELKCGPTQ